MIKSGTFKKWFTDNRVLLFLWALLGVISALTKLHSNNNFLIFRGSFWHLLSRQTLYGEYPEEYFDCFLYGPLFPFLVSPFAVLPVWAGHILWCTGLALFMYWSVYKSTLSSYQKCFVLWFCAHELLTALFMQQFNVAIAGIILIAYWAVEKEHDEWATLAIVIGTLVKLYGIVGLAFFFFSRHKVRFSVSLLIWSIIIFCLPMLLTGAEYQLFQYHEWYLSLTEKNALNADSIAQNISLLGMAHRISGIKDFSDLYIILPGMALFAATYFRIRQWHNEAFRETELASVLMFVCLFSTGTESSGYIIALTGVAIWYTAAPWQRSKWDIVLMVFCFILTSLSPSDLFPRYIRSEFVQPYALKALPVALIWFKMCYEMLTKDYENDLNTSF